ncbi:MAG: polysaccharide biosynthesis protein [Lachnospiraceae bacterium]|nr:polysaccharide biosynthesis protein [Lachnospiraceae bacterium]
MRLRNSLIKGTFILTLTGLVSRVIGFFYRIFMSHVFGEEGMGVYQLISPVMALSYSISCSTIQTAISKFVASEPTTHDYKTSLRVLYTGILISGFLSAVCSAFIYINSNFLAETMLMEIRCAPLLRIFALSLPFGALHSCINGYYYGVQKTSVPAITQLAEQFARVGSVYLIYHLFYSKNNPPSIALALIGLLIGEVFSFIISGVMVFIRFSTKYLGDTLVKAASTYIVSPSGKVFTTAKQILSLAVPLSANRIVVNILQSIEAVYIPSRLQLFGLSNSDALSIYGILSGMALPLILFPCALTNSVSVLLLPIISEAESSKNFTKIKKAVEKSILFCSLFGIFCTLFFLLFGKSLGNLLFDSPFAGSFILTLSFICPFLYISSTMSSILHGLGKAGTTFFCNVTGLLIRLFFVFFFIPAFGIKGYMWGLLASELTITLMEIAFVKHYIHPTTQCT